MPTTEPWLLVTPEQLKEGWVEHVGTLEEGFTIYRRPYLVLGRREDGNYVVRNPALQLQEEKMIYAPHTRYRS